MADAVVTLIAKKKMMRARAGEAALPKVVGMAFGSGGVNTSGAVITPLETQTTLNNELLRKEIDGYAFLSDKKCRYTCTLSNSDLAGTYLSEIALYDEDGDLIAIKNFLSKGKDADLEITMQMDDEF